MIETVYRFGDLIKGTARDNPIICNTINLGYRESYHTFVLFVYDNLPVASLDTQIAEIIQVCTLI